MNHMVTDGRIEKALFFIEDNLKRDIQLTDLADAAGMSKYHFHRLFVKTTGETPARCVARQKIHRAAHDLLMISDTQVIDIAFEYGFSSPAVFTRTFNKFMGRSPTRFRRERLAELGWDQRKRLDRARQKIPAKKTIPLRYFPRQIIAVKRCSLDPSDVNATYQSLISENPEGEWSFLPVPSTNSWAGARHAFAVSGWPNWVGTSEKGSIGRARRSRQKRPFPFVISLARLLRSSVAALIQVTSTRPIKA